MMYPTEEVVLYIMSEMLKNVQSDIAKNIKAKNNETFGAYDAAIMWKAIVGNRKPWDHKPFIFKTYGRWTIDRQSRTQYNFDIWSNIHYGFVGRSVGFSAWMLKAGAGYAQYKAGTSPKGYWERRFKTMGDADFLAAFDDPKDQAAIDIGIKLWEKHKLDLTANKILSAIRARKNELQIKK